MLIAGAANLSSCARHEYTGSIDPSSHPWLKGKKIFLDPGHGGTGGVDRFRQGPGGITEESINLSVALVLRDILGKAGAVVAMSRTRDKDVPLDERVVMAEKFGPDMLISIHHNGTSRRDDNVNYPSVLIWGSREVKPESYDLAEILLDEFHRIMDERGSVISDFTVFHETGTRILRKTAQLCPGVLGEGGFFSHEDHARRLADRHYLEREAEAYFRAISRYARWGTPWAEVHFSCTVKNDGILSNEIEGNAPQIALKLFSGNENPGIDETSLRVTLDGIAVKHKKIRDDLYLLNYGGTIHPGGHVLRFSFRNLRNQSSMIQRAGFTASIKAGDRDQLVQKGTRLVQKNATAREGVAMLMSALSMSLTDPEAGKIVAAIVTGFNRMGDRANAFYHEQRLAHFYPQTPESKAISAGMIHRYGYRFPVEFHGKRTRIVERSPLLDGNKKL
jgi:N-acetylmuramoyl-L-alanine amidase